MHERTGVGGFLQLLSVAVPRGRMIRGPAWLRWRVTRIPPVHPWVLGRLLRSCNPGRSATTPKLAWSAAFARNRQPSPVMSGLVARSILNHTTASPRHLHAPRGSGNVTAWGEASLQPGLEDLESSRRDGSSDTWCGSAHAGHQPCPSDPAAPALEPPCVRLRE